MSPGTPTAPLSLSRYAYGAVVFIAVVAISSRPRRVGEDVGGGRLCPVTPSSEKNSPATSPSPGTLGS
jgi:hypothetical protein